MISAVCALVYHPAGAQEWRIMEADLANDSAVSVSCRQQDGATDRICDLFFSFSLGGGGLSQIAITREIKPSGVNEDSALASLEVAPSIYPGFVALKIDGITVADGDAEHHSYADMRIAPDDFLPLVESGHQFDVIVEVGDSKFHTSRAFDERVKPCLHFMLTATIEEFRKQFRSAGHTVCGYYEHLHALRIASRDETHKLLDDEIAYDKAEKAKAEEQLRYATGPEALRKFLEKLNSSQ